LQEYERSLEEEAFPFEERAIHLHEKNLEMMRAGLFNAWIEKSLDRLAELVPGRYAKQEMSDGFLDAIDSYVYRHPVPPPSSATSDGADATPRIDSAPATQPASTAGGH